MEKLLIILAVIIAIVIILFISWILLVNYRYKQFKRNVKIKDMVNVYINEDKCHALILKMEGSVSTVQTIIGKKKVFNSDMYPIHGVKYKKL
jgi:hypothetical protein